MSENKSNMATIAVYYTKFGWMVTPKFYDCKPCSHVKNAYIHSKYFKIKSKEHSLI